MTEDYGLSFEAWDLTRAEFANADNTEYRAAMNLMWLTRRRPRWHDRDGRQGTVDILLERDDGTSDVVEVTSSIDHRHASDHKLSEVLAAEASRLHPGTSNWLLHFGHGWRMPRTNRKRRELVAKIVRKLGELEMSGQPDAYISTAPPLFARRDLRAGAGVGAASWSANVPHGDERPYLDRLSSYLSSSPLILRKIEKLEREGQRLKTDHRHLYLLLAPAGADGGLLPIWSTDINQGKFRPPPALTDLWLDGGSGLICHWNISSGWEEFTV
jgi:hypothetical protein